MTTFCHNTTRQFETLFRLQCQCHVGTLMNMKSIHIDILKIDMRFLEDLEQDGRSGNVIASVIRMAKDLDMRVVAEGVETKEQLDFLSRIGCDCIQGYYYSRPLPIHEYVNLLNEMKRSVE